MQKENGSKLKVYWYWFVKRLCLGIFDAFAVNLAYYLALVIRFYVNNEFRAVATERYLPAFFKFAPYYTILSLIVFVLFRLYNNRWKHAGLHDLNRIVLANLVTAAIHVAGTLLFVCRMPITYYVIGAVLQFIMIALCRFSYRLYVLESVRLRSLTHAKMNAMIVGVGETARILRQQIEADSTNVARPVCIFSYKANASGKMVNGLPVLADLSKLPEHFRKYQVQYVILADPMLPTDVRKQIREACEKSGIQVQDFSGYLTNDSHDVTLKKLMEYAYGPVEIRLDGKTQEFQSSEQALLAYPGKFDVKKIYARGDVLGVELSQRTVILNDTNQDWVKEAENKSGEEISFF